jgi:hypothetical protein
LLLASGIAEKAFCSCRFVTVIQTAFKSAKKAPQRPSGHYSASASSAEVEGAGVAISQHTQI